MNQPPRCTCVFPTPTEQELATIPGREPNTALKVFVEPGEEGYVRLQQLAYDASTGWYVQKSFIIPGEAVGLLVPELRKADCFIPKKARATCASRSIPFMRLTRDEDAIEAAAERRGA